jgi:hypothetical protein
MWDARGNGELSLLITNPENPGNQETELALWWELRRPTNERRLREYMLEHEGGLGVRAGGIAQVQ